VFRLTELRSKSGARSSKWSLLLREIRLFIIFADAVEKKRASVRRVLKLYRIEKIKVLKKRTRHASKTHWL